MQWSPKLLLWTCKNWMSRNNGPHSPYSGRKLKNTIYCICIVPVQTLYTLYIMCVCVCKDIIWYYTTYTIFVFQLKLALTTCRAVSNARQTPDLRENAFTTLKKESLVQKETGKNSEQGLQILYVKNMYSTSHSTQYVKPIYIMFATFYKNNK